jgi:hypothetical protein
MNSVKYVGPSLFALVCILVAGAMVMPQYAGILSAAGWVICSVGLIGWGAYGVLRKRMSGWWCLLFGFTLFIIFIVLPLSSSRPH